MSSSVSTVSICAVLAFSAACTPSSNPAPVGSLGEAAPVASAAPPVASAAPAASAVASAAPAPVASSSAAPASSAPAVRTAKPTDTFKTKKGDVAVSPIVHASVLLEVAGQAVYVDPWSKGDLTGLPKADFILISDVHFDHLDTKAIDQLSGPTTRIVTTPAVAKELAGRPRVVVMDVGRKQGFGLFDLETVPMYNLVRGPEAGKLFHDKGRGAGFVLTFGDKRFYFSGDTECTPEMKALASIDVAFVCMNLPYTMPPKEAAQCVNAFKPHVLFPYHYGIPGGPASNLDELTQALDPKAGVEVRVRRWY